MAWHLGNRHTPAEITRGAIYIQPDHVLAELVAHYSPKLRYLAGRMLERSGVDDLVQDIWLDVLRALTRDPDTAEALFAELALARGADARLDTAAAGLKDAVRVADQAGARRLVERMALTLQASLLVRHAPGAIADAFCATRLGGDWGHAYGTLPNSADLDAIRTGLDISSDVVGKHMFARPALWHRFKLPWTWWGALRNLVDVILDGGELAVTAQDALAVVAMIEAVERSIEERRPVAVASVLEG